MDTRQPYCVNMSYIFGKHALPYTTLVGALDKGTGTHWRCVRRAGQAWEFLGLAITSSYGKSIALQTACSSGLMA